LNGIIRYGIILEVTLNNLLLLQRGARGMNRKPDSGFFAFWVSFLVLIAIGIPANAVVPGDTLTVIQRPLVNLPAIVTPGSTLTVECEAASGTSGWAASLVRGEAEIPLTVQSSIYDPSTLWWTIQALVPAVPVHELYDLVVTANGGVVDTTWNAVRVIVQYLDDYYFIQITDTHLPTQLYYYEPGADTDSSEIVDLREIIRDVNLINPEFVVITGDFINEGELEDYLAKMYFSRSQRLLTEFEVPVYLTSGNHDIGGWTDTPPPAGTARRNWWKFFGWKRLDSPPAGAPYYTQDYSFDYGSVHYVGLEGYLNYESWRPEIYGGQSFTSTQMQWLNTDLAAASGSAQRVLFYHSDFSNQINLTNLGVGLTLSGHTHSNTEDSSYPYKIVTNNACNGERSYRMVRVSNGVIQPQATMSAGGTGGNLNATFTPANNGTNYTVTANITNNVNQRFEHGQLRFVMPNEPGNFSVTGGALLQVDASGPHAVCYVGVDILASSSRSVTVTLTPTPLVPPTVALGSPDGGEIWNMGSIRNITWTATDDRGVISVDILMSSDGGASYDRTIATGEPNDGIYAWLADVLPTSQARIKVIAYDADAGSGQDASNADFQIFDPAAGVGPDPKTPWRPVIGGNIPNPFSRETVIRFGVPRDGWVNLALYDVAGRLAATVLEGRCAAGYHEAVWTNGGTAESGIYFLRLRVGGDEVTRKVVITQ
jgi:predicted MPP superfamily phosphohydrolase